jgi:hypothetical protein
VILNLLAGLLATAVLVAAGLAVAINWRPPEAEDDSPLFHLTLALGWGFGLVPFIAFVIVLFTKIPLEPAITLGVAGAVIAGFGGHWWFRLDRKLPIQMTRGWKEAWPVLAAAAGVGLIYLLKYDRSLFFLESCIHRVVMQTLQLTDNPIDILASNADDQRLGNTSVISSFVALYRGLGFRLLYGFVGFCIAIGGYLLGRRALGGRGWGWFVLVFLPLNPYVVKIPLLDENLLTLGYSSLLLPLLLRRNVPWAHAGALFGLVIMMRHVAILCVPAILWAVYVHEGRRIRALVRGFTTFALVTLVAHIHHYMALGSIFKFESFGQIPEFEHRFLGAYSGLLQWPFSETVVRTPWNPLPTFLMWPVYLADHFGIILFSALLLGVVWLIRTRPGEGWFWLSWVGLSYLALSLQENWDVPNKMGVVYILFHPLVIWAGAGLKAAFSSTRWAVALITVALVCGFGIRSLRHLHVPDDQRYYAAWEGERVEDPAYVQAEREHVTDVAPWPDFGRLGPFARVFHPQKFSILWRDLADPSIDQEGTAYGWFPGEAVDLAAPSVIIEIDLSQRLFDRTTPFITLGDEGPVTADLTQAGGAAQVIPNLQLEWTDRPVTVLLSRAGADITGVSLIFEAWGDDPERRAYLHERYHRGQQMVLGWPANEILDARPVNSTSTTLRLRVPKGPFSLVESVNNAGQNYLFWRIEVAPSATFDVEGPYRVFHN